MKTAANVTRLWVDEFALASALSAHDLTVRQVLPSVEVLDSAGPARVVGNYGYSGSQNGFFDAATGASNFDQQSFTDLRIDESHYLSRAYGTAVGATAYLEIIRLTERPLAVAREEAVLLHFSHEGAGGLARGALLGSGAAAVQNYAGVNLGATVSGKTFAVHFHLIAIAAATITMKLQESQNDGAPDAYADIAGLTSGALAAAGIVRVTTTAATEAWKRLVVSGAFGSATIAVCAGLVASA